MLPLITNSRKYYRHFYRLAAFAVVLMTAVLTGSLMLGDSVRGTLVQRVDERLAGTETIIATGTEFMSETLTGHPLMKHAQGYLMMDGFVSIGTKLLPVSVWGTDADSLAPGEVLVNEPLSSKLAAALHAPVTPQQPFVLHLPALNTMPSGSLFVTKSYANQMRVRVTGIKSIADGGNLLLKNEQALPLNVFVSRKYLSDILELQGKINLVLAKDIITGEQLAECWTPELSGIHISDSSLTCDGVFIPQSLVEKMTTSPTQNENNSTLYFSYFVNELSSLRSPGATVNYSFVTAVREWGGEPLVGHDLILSDYAAERLHVREGDSVRMDYFVAKHLKNLDTRSQTFRVRRIEPLSAFRHDSLLLADFPGLTHVENCTDWDSDLPIDMSRITKADEDFWYTYRQTPKAVVAYDAVCADWTNVFGSATAIRFAAPPAASLLPADAGIRVIHPRSQGIQGAKGGVDFAGLFLALGFFIILSAILLMKNPLMEMFSVRQGEIRLYQQLGFSDKAITRSLFREAFSVILLASPVGVVAGLAYAGITLWLLGNVWSGATQTEGFALYIQPVTLLIGWFAALLICAFVLWRVLRKILKPSRSDAAAGIPSTDVRRHHLLYFILLFIPTVLLIALNFVWLHNMVVFIICGLLWILTWGMFLRLLVERQSSASARSLLSRRSLSWSSIRAFFRQHNLAYWTLSLGVFTVFAVGLNRPDFTQAVQQPGSYLYYIDSRVPIQYDLNNQAVRRKLSLQSLPDSTFILGFLRHTQDEASCLNLNLVTTPTVLGIDLREMAPFGLTPPHPSPLSVPGGSLNQSISPSPCRLYLDQESLLWSLKKSVGDTLYYQNDRGEREPVVIAGSYPTGIFHGNAIMSTEDFRRLWPKESGLEVLLLKSSNPDVAVEILSTALSEYGLNVQSVGERIKMFFEVTETYLIIFLTLGGLGLLLGIFSLIIIVRKNLTAQSASIRQLRSMGFSIRSTGKLLLRENLLVPIFAVGIGATGAVISISANIGGAGWSTLLLAALVLAAICLALYLGIKFIISQFLKHNTHYPQ